LEIDSGAHGESLSVRVGVANVYTADSAKTDIGRHTAAATVREKRTEQRELDFRKRRKS